MNIEAIIQSCKEGNSLAQKQLYDHFAPKMMGVCRRYLQDLAEAEDALICSFTKAFQHIDRYKADGPFEAWLRRITVNDCLDRIRKQKGIWMVQLEEHAEENHDPIQSSYSQAYLQSLIDALPLGYKTVFNLFAIEGYNHQEIAERLKISESTSKSQLSRARQYLQKQLQVHAAKTNKL